MTTSETATRLGAALGKRRIEVALTSQTAETLAGFDKAIYALVELALAGAWDVATTDRFWAAYDEGGLDSPRWTSYLDYPLGVTRS